MAKFVFDRERQEIVPKPEQEPVNELRPLPFDPPSLLELERELRRNLYAQYLGL